MKRQSCHIETSQLICRANQLTGFFSMMATLAFNESIKKLHLKAIISSGKYAGIVQ